MQGILLAAAVALVGGVAIGFQNPLASFLGQRVGILQGAFIIHVGGAIVAAAALLVVPGGQLAAWRSVPWYVLWAGALGVVLVSAVSFSIPRIGVGATVGLLLVAQLAIAAWLDHAGRLGLDVRPFDGWRLLGLILLVAGAWLVLRR